MLKNINKCILIKESELNEHITQRIIIIIVSNQCRH